MNQITPKELKRRLELGMQLAVLDVREEDEVALAPFPCATHIPMAELPSRLEELDPDEEIVVLCHHGIRSAQVVGYLVERGFTRVYNLSGGIDAWSREVDPSVPRY